MSAAPTPRRYATRLSLEERRPQLLDAALAVILERGYHGATLDAVAERAGVTKPVIYSAFSGRDTFFAALLDREEQRVLAAVAAAMPDPAALGTASPAAVRREVATGVERLLRGVADEPLAWRLVLDASLGTPEVVRVRVARDRVAILAGLRHIVGRGLALSGRADLDEELLALTLFGAVERLVAEAAQEPGRIDPARAGAVVAALLPAPASARR